MQRKVLLFALLFIALGSLIIVPQVLAESTIHVGPGGTTGCALGGCPLFNNEVNGFTTSIDLFQTSGGAPALDPTIWLIFAVPNDTSKGTALSISNLTSAVLNDAGSGYSPTAVPFGFMGFEGLMGPGNDVYSFLGKTVLDGLKVNKSNSFTNFAAWDLAVDGITAKNFGIYVFTFTSSDFDGKDFLNATVKGIPLGTFAVGWGEITTIDKHGHKHIKQFGTPFTEAGLETQGTSVPEPSSLMLLTSGLLGMGAFLRRKLKG